MKRNILLTVLVIFGMALLSGCAMIQTWPDDERNAENKMIVIQEKIGDGLKTGALTPDQSQMFLTTLKGIRTDYSALRNKMVYRSEWESIHVRLDVLGDEINRALSSTTRIQEPRNADRIVALQHRIDDIRISRRLSLSEERDLQYRLDTIRQDYMRMTEGGRYISIDEGADIARRLDVLETDLNRITRVEEPWSGDRIDALQRRIDDARINRRLTVTEERDFQYRLDSIRRDYIRMTEGGRYIAREEGADIALRLDLLETDLNRLR
jgi:nicotinamide mononucleotide adenylyltransferase